MIRFRYLSFCFIVTSFVPTLFGAATPTQSVAEKSYSQWRYACLDYVDSYDAHKATVSSFFLWLRTSKVASIHFNAVSTKRTSLKPAADTPSLDERKSLSKEKHALYSFIAQSIVNKISPLEKDLLADFASNKAISLPISKKEFVQARDAFIALSAKQLAESKSWVNPAANPSADLLNFKFRPYVQKCIVPTDATINIIGDLHGDAEALINTLDCLVKKGILFNDFTLKNNHYLVFLGDYTDRGPCGTEVLYALFRLKVANQDQVILLRGNHEDAYVNECPRFFGSELKNKFNLTTRADRQQFIYDLYELFPVALYLGTPKDEYVLFSHGGLEIGFDPAALLKAPAKTIFMHLETLNRKKALALLNLKDNTLKVTLGGTCFADNNDNFVPKVPRDLHFLWNDFRKELYTTDNLFHEAGWQYGELLTQAVLKRDNVKALIRGHNHILALEGGGLHRLYDGLVTTLTSFKSHGDSEFFKDYSYLTLQITPSFNNWELLYRRDGQKQCITLADASTHIPKIAVISTTKTTLQQKTVPGAQKPTAPSAHVFGGKI
jgi:hypothetical protein